MFIKRRCISIFSKIEFVDHSKPCTQIYLHNIASCTNLQLPVIIFKNRLAVSLAEIITNVDEVDLIMFNSISSQYKK